MTGNRLILTMMIPKPLPAPATSLPGIPIPKTTKYRQNPMSRMRLPPQTMKRRLMKRRLMKQRLRKMNRFLRRKVQFQKMQSPPARAKKPRNLSRNRQNPMRKLQLPTMIKKKSRKKRWRSLKRAKTSATCTEAANRVQFDLCAR